MPSSGVSALSAESCAASQLILIVLLAIVIIVILIIIVLVILMMIVILIKITMCSCGSTCLHAFSCGCIELHQQ